jgi:hypothetical protein
VGAEIKEKRGKRGGAYIKHLACHSWAQPVLATEINQPLQRGRGQESLNQSQSVVLLEKLRT